MAAKKTIGQKRQERNQKLASQPTTRKAGGDRIDAVIAQVNKRLDGQGRVFRGTEIVQRSFMRRSSGVPAVDYITNGGYPKGGLIEFGGEFSTGKTSLALEALAEMQREYLKLLADGTEGLDPTKYSAAWVALEPFSKTWARERGYFIPFSEQLVADPETGELTPLDPFEGATELEKYRMEQAGITDPYAEVTPFVLVQEWRGDVALDASLDFIRSNAFSYVVVDSLGVAKSTSWLEDKEVQDAGDFPREAKMIGDYTTRALLALNWRYDETNQHSKDGTYWNETTVLHLNHIVTEVGTQARAKHKTQRIKGGEGNKHNHHCIIFLWKGEQYQIQQPGDLPAYRYAQEVRCMAIKSKIGPPYMEGSYDFYVQPFGTFQTGDIDKVKSLVTLALQAGTVQRAGAYYQIGENPEDFRAQGREAFENNLRESPEWFAYLYSTTRQAMRRR